VHALARIIDIKHHVQMRGITGYWLPAGLVGLMLASAACGGPTSPPAAASASPSAGAGAVESVPLAAMPTGTAALTWDPNTKLITAAVDAYGFTPGSSHAMHIHPGTCANQTQPPSVPFADVTASAGGAVKQSVVSSTTAPAGIPTGSYLNIHLAPSAELGSPTDVSFTPIACADIPAGTPAQGPVTLTLQAPPKAGQRAQGSATIAYDATAHTLKVAITATALPPNSAHSVHIHSGTCQAQGDVLYPLPDLRTDATGAGSVSTTVSNVNTAPPATGWYVNLHLGPMSQILNGSQPTLLFAPLLCGDLKE
jgi:hypothetical protein